MTIVEYIARTLSILNISSEKDELEETLMSVVI
jgi:hypothetical protein